MDLLQFRHIGNSNRYVLSKDNKVEKSELTFGNRFDAAVKAKKGDGWDTLLHGTIDQRNENKAFKAAFYKALVKAEGRVFAQKAIRSASLPIDWMSNPSALGAREIKKIIVEAEEWRMGAIKVNNRNLVNFMNGKKRDSLQGILKANQTAMGWNTNDATSLQLREIFEREVKQHFRYPRRILESKEFKKIAIRACEKFYAQKQAQFMETFPHLAEYAQQTYPQDKDSKIRLDCESVFHQLENEFFLSTADDREFNQQVRDVLEIFKKDIQPLLSEMHYTPEEWAVHTNNINQLINELNQYKTKIGEMRSVDQKKFAKYFCLEIDQQINLLVAKKTFIQEIADHNPFSEKAVAYNNLIWAHVAKHLLQNITASIKGEKAQAAHLLKIEQPIEGHIKKHTTEYKQARNDQLVDIPNNKNKNKHPAGQARTQCLTFVRQQLQACGFTEKQISIATHRSKVEKAWSMALDQDQDWAIYRRTVLAHRDGITRQYQSIITPVSHFPDFKDSYQSNGSSHQGVSSIDKSNHQHARNLKVSELKRVSHAGKISTTIATVIGHGVLDMWEIEDRAKREQANKNGAHEVLKLALVSNDRAYEKALKKEKVKLTLVSVNLTTPAPWRELPFMKKTSALHNYQEKTYTDAQFKAFQDNIDENHEAKFQLKKNPSLTNPKNSSITQHDEKDHDQVKKKTNKPDFNRKSSNIDGESSDDNDAIIKREYPQSSHVYRADYSEDDDEKTLNRSDDGHLSNDDDNVVASHESKPQTASESGDSAETDGETSDDGSDEITATVKVDVIAFSFGINPLATGKVPDVVGGWDSVYKHNYKEMERFIGNLGTKQFFTNKSRIQGQRPGGFIGTVMDELSAEIKNADENDVKSECEGLAAKLQQQTDTVRNLFLSEAFKRGNGDPAKMGREILALQLVAEKALATIKSNQAAAAAKGCKSDKDRGGVTDVELKHKLITEDLGGQVIPDETLEDQDQINYNNVAISTQFGIQQYNTGLPGSKEAEKLDQRIPNKYLRQYLAGLSAFAEE